jgi:Fe-S-cluster containining protein
MALELAMSAGEFINKYGRMLKVSPHCALFDPIEKKCNVHGAKPKTCKSWPCVRQVLNNEDNLRKAASLCPGITLEPGDLPSVSSAD